MESWSYVRIFHSGDDYYLSLIQDIRRAKRSITIESYIFAIDRLTESILEELTKARARGCLVKIVVDGFGSYYWIPQLDKLCNERGIELRVFHPFPYPLLWARRLFARYSINGIFLFKKLNRRTHRKITIIDETRAYLGSFNFVQDHCQSYVGPRAWRDTGVALEGPAISRLVLAFQISYLRTYIHGLLNWVGRWRIKQEPFENILRLNTTQKTRRRLYRDLLFRITHAEKRIYVTTAYFLPKRSLLTAFLKAARRGVDVKILMPGKSDVPMVKWAAFYIVRFLLQKRIPIYEYQKTILHAKTMIIDDEAFVGSFNLNHRSLLHDLEVEAVLSDEESMKNMLQQWSVDLANSKLVSEKDFATRSWFARMLYRLAFRLRYML
ncbi:phosphatidylserine/phosphatidylglycerophosphate/cardiolipin synthase family protein [Bdellovibrio sp. 22V]|uniref:phospholipase D-like domain-containing protein n=1 Tax=Bdellovibrio TaxID=958 RepID=UPI002543B7DF|nr:phosphatidylserine/phosphatidylglycerophosphate/cardiolipin synthase family protein [Bdellovibrio sp. 22V]WII73807.1 phosphatidylserine/phosphatidylglycerophosphate/cardiolipin synthase family protein [Bdellovibrio sp. 22V]